MSLTMMLSAALRGLPGRGRWALNSSNLGPEDTDGEQQNPKSTDELVERDEELADEIETWFERGEEFDRRYGVADRHAG